MERTFGVSTYILLFFRLVALVPVVSRRARLLFFVQRVLVVTLIVTRQVFAQILLF